MRLLHGTTVLGLPFDGQLDRQLAGLAGADRALARALASGALRNLAGLDSLIDGACARPLPADARARQVLRIALAGRLLLDTPPHAAIATALPQLEGGPRRLVHGVLSTLFRTEATLAPATLPEPWATRWRAAWGAEAAEAAAAALGAVPPTDLCLKDRHATADWCARLGGESLFPGHVRLTGSRQVDELPGYAEGAWWVQDAAAQMPARLLGDVQGLSVLDLCAAPGGKTMQLAAAGARVTALDVSGRRLGRLAGNLARTGLSAEVVEADARRWAPGRLFDAVLLDAPCSATGTFRRNPDILYLKGALDLGPLLALQAELSAVAARLLKPGGRMVYAVCSLEPAEGEGAAPPAGPDGQLVSDPVMSSELPPGLSPADGAVRILPSAWAAAGGADGFYISRWRKPVS